MKRLRFSDQRIASSLQKGRRNANIHARSRVIREFRFGRPKLVESLPLPNNQRTNANLR
jgi:hypothetical protein